jgi:L-ascorbate metabolism protein UlaG (beta-lactamase superfamily)
LDFKPVIKDSTDIIIPQYNLAIPHKNLSVGEIMVHTIPAIGRGYGGAQGVGYIVEVDGIKILFSGFFAAGYDESQIKNYQEEIDSLKTFAPIDIAILPVGGHLEVNYEPYKYLLDHLSPKVIYLMGGDAATEEYPKCVAILEKCNVPVKYPESGRAMGERFHYLRK